MDFSEIKRKFVEGHKLAFKKLVEKKRKENSYLIFSHNGKIEKVSAWDIKLDDDNQSNNKDLPKR